MKSNSLLFFFVLVSFGLLSAQAPTHDWVIGIGGSSIDYAYSLSVDKNRNTFVSGTFRNTADFDPGVGTDNRTAIGSDDLHLSKFDSLGNQLWTRTIGGTSRTIGYEVNVDTSGNVYLGGYFQGNIDFDPGPGTFPFSSNGSNDAFFSKWDGAGNLLWAFSYGTTGDDRITSFDVDDAGNTYLTGLFENTLDFDPGTGVANLTSNGDNDIFIAKYDPNGNYLWAKSMGGTVDDGGYSLALGPNDNIHLTGYYEGTVDFDPGTGTSNLTSSSTDDIFFAKYSNSGAYLWAKSIVGSGGNLTADIVVDDAGNPFLLGNYSNTIDADPGPGLANLTWNGGYDLFLAKYDTSGNYTWAISFGGPNFDYSGGIVLDDAGNPIVTGRFKGTVDFNPGAANDSLVSNTQNDVFLAKYSTNGNYLWAVGFGGPGYEAPNDIDIDQNGDLYLSGTYDDNCDFIPGPDSLILSPVGSYDFYVSKFGASSCSPASGTDVQTACGSFLWIDGNTYTSSNNTATFTITGGAANGCDSTVTLDLTVNQPATGTDVQTACGSFLWIDGNTYTSSNNTATFTLTGGAANGCDSIVTLDLTINQPATGTDVQTACGSFLWIDGNTYTSSNNTATFTITGGAANGCDSTVTLDLTVVSIDNNVTQAGSTLTADQAGATYQWLDCAGMSPISGATNQSYTPTTTGDYAVEIMQSGCTDTSSCYNVMISGILEHNFSAGVSLYPNPSNGDFTLELGDRYSFAKISILDMTGRVLISEKHQNCQTIHFRSSLAAGMYLFKVEADGNVGMLRFIVE